MLNAVSILLQAADPEFPQFWGAPWRFVASPMALPMRCLPLCGALWRYLALCGVPMAHSAASWRLLALPDAFLRLVAVPCAPLPCWSTRCVGAGSGPGHGPSWVGAPGWPRMVILLTQRGRVIPAPLPEARA